MKEKKNEREEEAKKKMKRRKRGKGKTRKEGRGTGRREEMIKTLLLYSENHLPLRRQDCVCEIILEATSSCKEDLTAISL